MEKEKNDITAVALKWEFPQKTQLVRNSHDSKKKCLKCKQTVPVSLALADLIGLKQKFHQPEQKLWKDTIIIIMIATIVIRKIGCDI